MKRFILFSVLICGLGTSIAATASEPIEVSANVASRITSCVQNMLKDKASRRPRTSELKLGEDWVCTKILYLKPSEIDSKEMMALVVPYERNSIGYHFQKQGWGVQNSEGSVKSADGYIVDYLVFNDGGIDGLLGIPFGIRNGFFMDFLRINPQGELVSEESILDSDIPHYIVSPQAPDALATDRHKVYSYSVCKTKEAVQQNSVFSCFENVSEERL